jgi:hypothetical protein
MSSIVESDFAQMSLQATRCLQDQPQLHGIAGDSRHGETPLRKAVLMSTLRTAVNLPASSMISPSRDQIRIAHSTQGLGVACQCVSPFSCLLSPLPTAYPLWLHPPLSSTESISAAADDEIDRWFPGACAWACMRRDLETNLEG